MNENDKLNKVAYKQGSICISDMINLIESKRNDNNIELDKLEWDLGVVYEKRVDKFGNPTYNKRDLSHVNEVMSNLTKEKPMEIKDIKAGYLVEFMSGDLALAVPNELDDIMFVYSDGYCISSARDYDSIYDIDENPEYNIVKVYSAIKGYQCLFPLSTDRRDLLWSREIKLNCEDCPHMKEYKRSL